MLEPLWFISILSKSVHESFRFVHLLQQAMNEAPWPPGALALGPYSVSQ